MYCPYCGAKNDSGSTQCFVCERKIPSFDESSPRARAASAAKASGGSSEQIAALGDRLIAVVLDTIFVAALFWVAAQALSRWTNLQSFLPTTAWAFGVTAGAYILVFFLYYWLLEGAFGATLGKAVAGIQVRPTGGGGRIGFRAALWRNLLRLVDGIGFYFLGYLVALFSRQNRRIGDYVAGTIVVQRNMAWGERVTVILLWLIGVAGASWGAYTVCPRCVNDRVSTVVQQIGVGQSSSNSTPSVPHLASN